MFRTKKNTGKLRIKVNGYGDKYTGKLEDGKARALFISFFDDIISKQITEKTLFLATFDPKRNEFNILIADGEADPV